MIHPRVSDLNCQVIPHKYCLNYLAFQSTVLSKWSPGSHIWRPLSPVMARFHDVSIYRGSRLVTTTTRLEVAARSPYLQQLLTSIRMCDGCKEPTTLIFPAEDETQNTLQEMFKSMSVRTGQSRFSIVESKSL